jgi:hypothetical protein
MLKHIIVCGHYGCGGVNAAMSNSFHGFVDNWLRNIKDVYHKHEKELVAALKIERIVRIVLTELECCRAGAKSGENYHCAKGMGRASFVFAWLGIWIEVMA